MEKEDLLERYEAYGDESVYAEAKRLYEEALAGDGADARVLNELGYLQECHGRRSIRAAVDCYQRAIDMDPQWPKPHLQLIHAVAALGETHTMIDRYHQRLAGAPGEPSAHRFLAQAYLYAHDYDHAAQVIGDGLELAPDDPALIELQGDLFAATGRVDDALARWQRAFTIDPDNLSRATARRSSWSARTAWPKLPGNGSSSSGGATNADTQLPRTGPDANCGALSTGWQAADLAMKRPGAAGDAVVVRPSIGRGAKTST